MKFRHSSGLSQLNPISTFTPCFSKIHFNIIPKSNLDRASFSLELSTPKYLWMSHFHHSATCPTPLILLGLITLTAWREEYKLWNSSFCSVFLPSVTFSYERVRNFFCLFYSDNILFLFFLHVSLVRPVQLMWLKQTLSRGYNDLLWKVSVPPNLIFRRIQWISAALTLITSGRY
jgi:hypothetical protein